MTQRRDWLTIREIVAHALRRGVRVTRAQFNRWRKRGLLPRPTLVSLGYGKGRQARYPRITARQIVAAAQLMRRYFRRNLDSVGWYLWCLGYPTDDAAIRLLLHDVEAVAADAQGRHDEFAQGVDADSDGADPYASFQAPRPLPGWGGVRRRIGRTKASMVARVHDEIALGLFTSTSVDQDELGVLVDASKAWINEGRAAPDELTPDLIPLLQQVLPDVSALHSYDTLLHTDIRLLRDLRDRAQAGYRIAVCRRDALMPRSYFLFFWFTVAILNPSVQHAMRAGMEDDSEGAPFE